MIEIPSEEREDSNEDSETETLETQQRSVNFCFVSSCTYPEVIINIAREDGVVIVWSLQIGRFFICLLSKLFLEPLLVADNYLLVFGLQQTDECLNDVERSTSERHKNQDLPYV